MPSLLLDLQRATHATLHLLASDLADLDLTASEINALGNLADGAPRTVSRLGADVGTKPATLTGILDRLERRGLITRGVQRGDRRAVLIELTPAGAETAAIIRQALHDLEARALGELPAASIEAARAVLRALAEAVR